jgi:hypothetical protein
MRHVREMSKLIFYVQAYSAMFHLQMVIYWDGDIYHIIIITGLPA